MPSARVFGAGQLTPPAQPHAPGLQAMLREWEHGTPAAPAAACPRPFLSDAWLAHACTLLSALGLLLLSLRLAADA